VGVFLSDNEVGTAAALVRICSAVLVQTKG
jgi:hypothetical protein